jgi:ABC-type dipeptide/oligopeptide/nickel transport system ATPase component
MTSTVIQDEMKELKAVEAELKSLNEKSKELRSRKKELTSSILDWLVKTDRPGCMYEELVVLRGEGKSKCPMKKKEKEAAAIKVLEEQGIQQPEKIYENIKTAMSGEREMEPKLSIKLAHSL